MHTWTHTQTHKHTRKYKQTQRQVHCTQTQQTHTHHRHYTHTDAETHRNINRYTERHITTHTQHTDICTDTLTTQTQTHRPAVDWAAPLELSLLGTAQVLAGSPRLLAHQQCNRQNPKRYPYGRFLSKPLWENHLFMEPSCTRCLEAPT